MTQFLQLLANGVVIGGIYGLVALGFTVIYKSTGVFNFAQGTMMLLGAFLTASLVLHTSLILGIVLGLVAMAVLGALTHLVVMHRMMGRPLLAVIMVTIGISLIIPAAVQMAYGSIPKPFPKGLSERSLELFTVRVTVAQLIVLGATAVCLLASALLFRYTRLGLHMRAASEDFQTSVACGVRPNATYMAAWAIGLVLACVGGIALGNLTVVSPDLADVGLLAFPAVVIGGLQSLPGAVIGGLVVGLLEEFGAGYISPAASSISVYLPLLLILLIRPWGFFGRQEQVRA